MSCSCQTRQQLQLDQSSAGLGARANVAWVATWLSLVGATCALRGSPAAVDLRGNRMILNRVPLVNKLISCQKALQGEQREWEHFIRIIRKYLDVCLISRPGRFSKPVRGSLCLGLFYPSKLAFLLESLPSTLFVLSASHLYHHPLHQIIPSHHHHHLTPAGKPVM